MLKISRNLPNVFYKNENGVTIEFKPFTKSDVKDLGVSNYALMRGYKDPAKPTVEELQELSKNTLHAVAKKVVRFEGIVIDDVEGLTPETIEEAVSILEVLIEEPECSDLVAWIGAYTEGQKKT